MSGAGAGAGLRALGREELRRRCAEPRYLDKLMTSLKRDVLGDGGEELLDCLLNGIPDAPAASLNNKIKVIDIVLSRLRSETTSLNHCGKLVSRVCMELPRAPTEDIVRWCEDSIDSLVHDTDVNMIWCDILPECLSVLLERGTLVHCGTQMSATDFKDQCVRTLCQCRWNERLVVRLAEMFKDMHLEREAHGQVVSKLCTQMMDMPPDSVPPLLHQLLKLCRCHHMESVLAYLSHYFNVKLYSRLQPTPQDSDSTNMDLEDFGAHTATELMACLSTCVLHIKTSSPELVRKHIKLWPRSQLLRNPFILEPALALSEGSTDNKILCLSVLKSAIQQRCLDEQRCRDSAWIRSVLPNDVDVKRILKVVIGQSIHHRQLTVSGLINLAFSLLSTSPLLGREHLALASWSFAKLILVRLAKSQPETTGHILSLLSDKLAGDFTSQRQYADCLLVLCKLTPLSVECCPQLSTILENCQASSTDFRTSAPVLDAVHPILKFSSRVRDRLVMICRKGLFTRDSSSRCLALSGFLSLLRHIKLPAGAGAGSLSNTSSEQYSVHSYLTQISIDLHSTQQGAGVTSHVRNEAVCLEVVSILRRCFTQDAQVKQLLYSSIFDCVRSKPSLHEAIMELLLEQLGKYISDEDGLQLEKCVQVNATTAVLIEPVGYLLLCTQQFLQAPDEESSEDILASQTDEQGAQYYRNKLRTVMNKLADEFAKYQMTHFDMQEGEHGLSDLTPESKAKSLRTQQALHVYEALMAYRLMEWSVDSDNPATGLYALFKVYNQLLEHTKQAPKGNKKGPKSLNETTDKSQKTQKTQKATRDKQKGPVKLSHMAKGKVGPFKQLPCLWDLAVCCRILDLLYSAEVPWATREQWTQIRTKRDIHHFALRSVQSVLGGDVRRCSLLADGTRAARILYTRCIARFQEISDFDEPTALGCLDSFRECLSTAANPHNHIDIEKFLREVTDSSDGSAGDCLASILECAWSALQQLDSEADSEAEQDAMTRRINVAVVQLVSVALSKIPHEPCEQLLAVSQKLEQFVRTSKRDSLALIPSLLAAGCRHTRDTRLMDDLIDKLTAVLHLIEEDDSNMETDQSDVFPAINETTGQTVFGYVCAHVCARSAHVEHVLGRAKELHAALKYSTQQAGEKNEKDLKELEKAVVVQLCGAAGRVCRLAALRCAVGAAGTDRALQAAVRLYSPLTALLKHLARRPTHTHIRLEKLLKLCGKRLSGFTDNLIIYVESSGSGGAQGGAGRVLRDTRLLPRLVYETEQFCKCVILLSNKTKTNYEQYLSHGTARDFRIQAPVLQEALRGQAEEEPDDEREAAEEPAVEADINDAETEVLSVACSRSEEEDSEEEAQPSSKRPRVSSF